MQVTHFGIVASASNHSKHFQAYITAMDGNFLSHLVNQRSITMKNFLSMILFIVFAVTAYADEPSFDCSKATTAVELKICNNNYLSDLDGLLAYNYKNAPWSEWDENGKRVFKSEQKAWMVKRNACRDENCIADAYKSRIDEICAIPTVTGVNDCIAWEKLGLDVDVASQAKVSIQ